MRPTARTVLALVLALPAIACALTLGARPERERDDGDPPAQLACAVPESAGTGTAFRAGCAAVACHGAPATTALATAPDERTGAHSATLWLARDPHARATEALAGPLGRRIVANLRADEPEQWVADPLDEVKCLACHSNPTRASGAARNGYKEHLRAEGVGCESCHGPANGWLLDHTNWTADERPARYAAQGMTPLYDIGTRALVCAGCHVGAPAEPNRAVPLRDVNHQMIAAGHPRLNFELADYQRRLPPHWHERDRTRAPSAARPPEFEVQVWAVGRVASTEAAARLLADRAHRAGTRGAEWPELSESNCFVCHRELRTRDAARAKKRSGSEWQSFWPLTHRDHGARFAGTSGSGVAALAEVGKLQQAFNRREPDPARVAALAEQAAEALRDLRLGLAAAPPQAAVAATTEMYRRADFSGLEWDETAQATYGLMSLETARIRGAPPGERLTNPLFEPLVRDLTFSRALVADHFDSPRRWNRTRANESLRRLALSVVAELDRVRP